MIRPYKNALRQHLRDKINSYLAILIVTIVGACATIVIVQVVFNAESIAEDSGLLQASAYLKHDQLPKTK